MSSDGDSLDRALKLAAMAVASGETMLGPGRLPEGGGPDRELMDRLERRFLGSFARGGELDAADMVATGVAICLGAAIDVLLVAIPKDVNYLGEHRQAGSVLTRLFKSWNVDSDNALAGRAKASFDGGLGDVPGMSAGNHRFMTPGHDPILGLVVGVFDLLRGGRTAIGRDGCWRFAPQTGDPASSVFAAIAIEILHLLSDAPTKMGLPPPLMTLAGLLRVGSFGSSGRTLADLARYMYETGYDLRHFVTTATVPTAMRLVLGAYFLGRRWLDAEYGAECLADAPREGSFLRHPRFVRMTFYADCGACAANAGKIALFAGNPSAFNYAQWLAIVGSAARFAADRLESPTEILLDRARANEVALRAQWLTLRDRLGLGDVDDPMQLF